MDRRMNNMSAKEYVKIAPQLAEACDKANKASYDARPTFTIYGDGAERVSCSVGHSDVVGLGLQLDGYINIETVPEFLRWLQDVFPEQFKKVAAGG